MAPCDSGPRARSEGDPTEGRGTSLKGRNRSCPAHKVLTEVSEYVAGLGMGDSTLCDLLMGLGNGDLWPREDLRIHPDEDGLQMLLRPSATQGRG